jgi:alpha-amylase/alpha-mannosidase (GH57 family)
MEKYICIHGHFYQPPRENPWLNEVEVQDSAYPFHDWNERITAECYARNSASRILDEEGKVVDIINNYARMSFNFGPTLIEWMEKKAPDIYEAIIRADKESLERFNGHGSAVAQVFNHMIMPLANERDKHTQVIWGIKDFESRYNRYPEGIWLGETAADTATLEVLAAHDIKYTILSPYQANKYRKIGEEKWHDAVGAKIDPRRAYKCNLPSGKSIALFFYDGPVSQGIAFEGLLNSGEAFAERLLSTFTDDGDEVQLMHIATDGETYGHHHKLGEMALSYALHHIEENNLAKVTVYGEFLEMFPPEYEAQITENTSWSCAHGVERWRSNCGCNTGGPNSGSQEWRKPIRESFNWLRDELVPYYEQEMSKYCDDPWHVRNEYISIAYDRRHEKVVAFLKEFSNRELKKEEEVQFLKLLEMQYHAMLMFTSCGWFFDEVSGLETVQDIMYASRAVQLAKETGGPDLEEELIERLTEAKSNIKEMKNAGEHYRKFVMTTKIDLMRVGAHYAVLSLFSDYPEDFKLYSFTAHSAKRENYEAGRQKLAVGRARIFSEVTWEETTVSFAVLHMGDHHLFGGVREFQGDEAYGVMHDDIVNAFRQGNVQEVINYLDKHFGMHNYSFWHLFRDDQIMVLNKVFEAAITNIEYQLKQTYDTNYPLVQAIQGLNMKIPKPIKMGVDFIINNKLKQVIEASKINVSDLRKVIDEVEHISVGLDQVTLGYLISRRIVRMMRRVSKRYAKVEYLKGKLKILEMLLSLPIELDLWEAQNVAFHFRQDHYEEFGQKAEQGDERAQQWVAAVDELMEQLNMKL